jgi:hypothetical protein
MVMRLNVDAPEAKLVLGRRVTYEYCDRPDDCSWRRGAPAVISEINLIAGDHRLRDGLRQKLEITSQSPCSHQDYS